jgi:hypothetical protein
MDGIWAVFKNGKYLGIKETNYAWASKYWANQCTQKDKYTLRKEV